MSIVEQFYSAASAILVFAFCLLGSVQSGNAIAVTLRGAETRQGIMGCTDCERDRVTGVCERER